VLVHILFSEFSFHTSLKTHPILFVLVSYTTIKCNKITSLPKRTTVFQKVNFLPSKEAWKGHDVGDRMAVDMAGHLSIPFGTDTQHLTLDHYFPILSW
jgi:hypothetical protein